MITMSASPPASVGVGGRALIEHHVCEMVARKPSDTSGEVDESARGADGENQSADSSAEKTSRAIRVGVGKA